MEHLGANWVLEGSRSKPNGSYGESNGMYYCMLFFWNGNAIPWDPCMVYSPTFTIKINQMREIYQSHGSYGHVRLPFLQRLTFCFVFFGFTWMARSLSKPLAKVWPTERCVGYLGFGCPRYDLLNHGFGCPRLPLDKFPRDPIIEPENGFMEPKYPLWGAHYPPQSSDKVNGSPGIGRLIN